MHVEYSAFGYVLKRIQGAKLGFLHKVERFSTFVTVSFYISSNPFYMTSKNSSRKNLYLVLTRPYLLSNGN